MAEALMMKPALRVTTNKAGVKKVPLKKISFERCSKPVFEATFRKEVLTHTLI